MPGIFRELGDERQRNGWKTSGKKEVENRDLWELLIAHTHKHSISWHKVKGHSDNAYRIDATSLRGALLQVVKQSKMV